jgi:hypothetical protein
LVNSKSMGGLAIMLGGAAIDWKAWRFHTVVIDSTSAEMMATSRTTSKMYYYRRMMQFLDVEQSQPSWILTDNDGVWSIARDATGTTSLIYIIRHVRFVQQAQEDGEVIVSQVDGRINPTDGLTKWLPRDTKKRDFAFLMGFPEAAYKTWIESKVFTQFTPRKIVPPAKPAIEVSNQLLNTSSATLRVTTETPPEVEAEAPLASIVPPDTVPTSFLSELASRPYMGVRMAPMLADGDVCFTIMDNEVYTKRYGYAHFLTAPREFVLDCEQHDLTRALLDAMVAQATAVVAKQVHAYNEDQLWLGFHVPPNNSVPWLHMHALYPKSIVTREPLRGRWTSPRFSTAQEVRARLKS